MTRMALVLGLAATILLASPPSARCQDDTPVDEGDPSQEETFVVERDFDHVRQGLMADLDQVIERVETLNESYQQRVNDAVDRSILRLEKLREVTLSIQRDLAEALAMVRALLDTFKEVLALTQEDLESVVDDLVHTLLGQGIKDSLSALPLDEAARDRLEGALDERVLPGMAEGGKAVIRGVFDLRVRLRERLTPREYRRYQEERAKRDADAIQRAWRDQERPKHDDAPASPSPRPRAAPAQTPAAPAPAKPDSAGDDY